MCFIMEVFDFMGGSLTRGSRRGFAKNVRAILSGPSGCGKTNLAINLALLPERIDNERLIIFTTTPNQPLYEKLTEMVAPSRLLITCEEEDIRNLTDGKKTLIVFDDIMLQRQKLMKEMFSAGRHNNISTLYLAQTYNMIPAGLIRDNANMIFLFPQCDRNLEMVHRDHCNNDYTFPEFKRICLKSWNKPHDFLTIDKTLSKKDGRYKKCLQSKVE